MTFVVVAPSGHGVEGLDIETDPAEFRELPLEAHALVDGVPLHDVTAVELPGGGMGRTIGDVRALIPVVGLMTANPVTRSLFALRSWLGRLFGWTAQSTIARPRPTYRA